MYTFETSRLQSRISIGRRRQNTREAVNTKRDALRILRLVFPHHPLSHIIFIDLYAICLPEVLLLAVVALVGPAAVLVVKQEADLLPEVLDLPAADLPRAARPAREV